MVSHSLKESYNQNVPVKIILKNGTMPIVGRVVGGRRSQNGEDMNGLTSDGFYSYTIKVIPAPHNMSLPQLEEEYITVLASDILNVESIHQ